jgi:peptidoglycan/xylan/chitin deacetylase (PgdA/CDA1 family)
MTAPYPVVIGICLDAEAIWTGQNPEAAKRPVMLSQGAFAIKEGLAPLLDLLDRSGVRATFYIPGVTADRYPDAVLTIHRRGHEIASHTYDHRSVLLMTQQEEELDLIRGIDALAAITGERPLTWRSASWEWSARTLDLLLRHGVTVSANYHDRLRPYRHVRDGAPVDLVELPVQWHLADAPFFRYGGQIGRTIDSAGQVQTIWQDEFDALYEMPGTFYHLTLHVQLIGHPGRLRMLERHLNHIRGHERVTFMTAQEIAATVG